MSELEPKGTRRAPRSAFRLAFAAAASAVPLVLFGGSVTTIGAGLAVDGWLVPEGHFLMFFPVEKWFRDPATFVEHTHRLFGVLVGLFAVAALLVAWTVERRSAPRLGRWLTLAAFLAVGLQGTLGGLRVLARDSEVAFLHGALAQAVFACLCASAFALSPAWLALPAARASERARERVLGKSALVALCTVYAAIVAGAWYRHGLRPAPVASIDVRFGLHLAVMATAVFALGKLAASLQSAAEPALQRARRRLVALLALQVLLGFSAWTSQGSTPGTIGMAEWGLSIAHVLGGGLVLSQSALLWMALRRRTAAEPEPVAAFVPEGAQRA
jgi:cytochrome c oxidase assembly protein subunit 15